MIDSTVKREFHSKNVALPCIIHGGRRTEGNYDDKYDEARFLLRKQFPVNFTAACPRGEHQECRTVFAYRILNTR